MSLKAKLYIAIVGVLGFAVAANQLAAWQSTSLVRYGCYFLVGLLTAGLKVSLPSIKGTLSVNFLFILFGIVEMTLPETVLMACAVTAVQCIWNPARPPRPIQVYFNVATVAITTVTAHAVYTGLGARIDALLRLAVTAGVFFLLNTLLVAVVIALTDRIRVAAVWRESYFWSLPYYLVGAAIATLMSVANRYVGWQTALLVIPVVYLIYRSYGLYLGRLEDEKTHAEEMAALHLRTIEALALAIEAKDHTTHDHLRARAGLRDGTRQGTRA